MVLISISLTISDAENFCMPIGHLVWGMSVHIICPFSKFDCFVAVGHSSLFIFAKHLSICVLNLVILPFTMVTSSSELFFLLAFSKPLKASIFLLPIVKTETTKEKLLSVLFYFYHNAICYFSAVLYERQTVS